MVTFNGQNWERDVSMNVGWKSNDSSLIFSGHLRFGFLPFCLLAPDIIFDAIDTVYIFLSDFPLYLYNVCFLHKSCVAGHEHHNNIVRRIQVAIM